MVKQILPKAGEAILALFNKLGGNMNNVLGSRSNITFLGKGKSPEGFIDADINIDAIGVLGKNKVLEELESSIGYLTAGKLNDVQANKLLSNMQKVDEVFNPKQIANITDLATGTRNLDQEGLGSLRATADDTVFGLKDYDTSGMSDVQQKVIQLEEKLGRLNPDSPTFKKRADEIIDELARLKGDDIDLPPVGSRGGPDDIAAPVQDTETTIRNLEAQDPELAAQFKRMLDDGTMVVSNQGGTPAKRATAREFLVEALKKENPNQTGLADIIDEVDVKYITEGGGGIAGDPLVLVNKYFGPRIAEMIPEGASSEEIVIFTKRILDNVVDAAGNKPDNPNFDRMTARLLEIDIPGGPQQPFAEGGRAGFFGGGLGRLGKAGYQAIRKYGIEAEDITDLFKSLATDKTLVGKEKTEYFKMLNQVLKNPDDYPDGVREILMRLGKPIDFAEGGRAGYQEGGGIESRLEELGGDVTSAEKTLQDLTKRLQTAGSSIPEGGGQLTQLPAGGLGSLASSTPSVQTPNLNAFKDPVTGGGQPANFLNFSAPDKLTPIDPYKNTMLGGLSQDGQRFDSAQSAFDALADYTKKQREANPYTRNMIGTEMYQGDKGFENFTNYFNQVNDPSYTAPSPQLLSAEQQKSFPGSLYAKGGLAKILEV